ncbi:hypothetical protein [Dokdonia sp.]|uniref:hypothetical protein n=1 Tax=Dokdonia sp. TaxID=2024995 RepID=UPI0032670B37
MLGLGVKIKAGALQFAILISVVIAVIISAFILLTYMQLQFAKQLERSSNTIKLSHMGIAYAKQQPLIYGDSIEIPIENELKEELTVIRTHWGIFDKVLALAKSKNFTSQKIGILGGQLSKEDRPAIYLEDTNSPLVVVGETTIYGNVTLPRQGIKPGNIVGNYYQGEKLVYGTITQNASIKPQLSEEKKSYINDLLFGSLPQQDSLFIGSYTTKISSSFTGAPKWIYSPDVIHIDNQSIENNIIIKSDSLIRISAFAKAKNVILVAPHIIIEDNATGSFQAFASKSIRVGENTKLSYPSVLLLQEKKKSLLTSKKEIIEGITLDKESTIQGSVIHLGSSERNDSRSMITISETATIEGEIYSDQIVQVSGIVKGSIFTHQFATKTRGSVYKNHLFNAVIDTRKLSESFCGLITTETQTNLVQWVY